MAYDAEFGEWVREHFHALGRLEIKRMFGGAGVYAAGVMFAVLDDGVIWLKADEVLAAALEAEGAHPFTYSTKAGASVSLGFWSLPEAALDDAETATAWARRSLDVALKKAAEKKPRKPRSR